jgi:hypothetical protein
LPTAPVPRSLARRSMAVPWRERPRVYTVWAAKPATSAWSLTPRCPVSAERLVTS